MNQTKTVKIKPLRGRCGKKPRTKRGAPAPLGATLVRGGVNFAIFSSNASAVTLLLFEQAVDKPFAEIPLDNRINKTGNIWHVFVECLEAGDRYGYRVDGPPHEQDPRHQFNPNIELTDPYSRAFSGASEWATRLKRNGEMQADGMGNRRRSMVLFDDFEWGTDRPLNIPLADTIIYELHVRGFTRHHSANVANPGTYRGLIQKIPYLKALGITAIELLPVCEFEELKDHGRNPLTGEQLINFWGYNSIGFFAPKSSYAVDGHNGAQVTEFKEMVKAMHAAGIEVILDMVFNHTGEGGAGGPVFNFKGLDNSIYYIVDPQDGRYHNYSGTGNTVNCNHPVVRDLILDALRYWVTEMHVDGFRFDLASILGRGQDGSVLANPPLLERIAYDPVLANTKLIAEAWDAAGLYQVGSFPSWGRWAEWNGPFRDDVRCFVKSDPGFTNRLAARLSGSSDLYQGSGRAPSHSINFVTSHDGFTLNDLVSYNQKYNLSNGENNLDGDDANHSWNCGEEGPSTDPQVIALRHRQQRNFATILLLSHGVPMICAGDEMRRSQNGNNNAYCQDNDISWIDWGLLAGNHDLFRYFQQLIAFRRSHINLRSDNFDASENGGPQLIWHGKKLYEPDWTSEGHSLGMLLQGNPNDNDIYIIFNAYWEAQTFQLPPLRKRKKWHLFADTAKAFPNDICLPGEESLVKSQKKYEVRDRSVVVLIAK